MIAKFVLCVALCFALSGVSLARPEQQLQYEDKAESTVTTEQENTLPCKESMLNVLARYNDIVKLSENTLKEVHSTVRQGMQCIRGYELFKIVRCIRETIVEKIEAMRAISHQLREGLSKLHTTIEKTIEVCAASGFMELVHNIATRGLEYIN